MVSPGRKNLGFSLDPISAVANGIGSIFGMVGSIKTADAAKKVAADQEAIAKIQTKEQAAEAEANRAMWAKVALVAGISVIGAAGVLATMYTMRALKNRKARKPVKSKRP